MLLKIFLGLMFAGSAFATDIFLRSGESFTSGNDRFFCNASGSDSQITCECRSGTKEGGISCDTFFYQGIKVRIVNGQRQEQPLSNPTVYYSACVSESRRHAANQQRCAEVIEQHPECRF